MIPKKVKDHIHDYYQINEHQLPKGLSEQELETLILFFYKKLREAVSSMKYLRVEVPGMGYFKIRSKKLDYEIGELRHWLRFNKNTAEVIVFKKKEQLALLEQLAEDRNKEWDREKLFREMRKEYIRQKKNTDHDTEGEDTESLGE